MRLAQNKIEVNRIKEVVNNLPDHSKFVLHSILITHRHYKKAGMQMAITTGEIYSVYKDLCQEEKYNSLTQRRISDFISELDMLGIINARIVSKGRQGQTREIQIQLSSDIIQSLYEDEMFKELAQYKYKNQSRLM